MAARKQTTETAAVWEDASALVPWDRNPRVNDHVIEDVATSIKRFGFAAPIVARKKDKVVIAGHTRLKAAMKLGLTKVPVRYMDLDPADSELLALADNKLNELAFWDDSELARILAEVGEDDFSVAGFDEDESVRLLAMLDEGALALPSPIRVEGDEADDRGSAADVGGEPAPSGIRMFNLMLTEETHSSFLANAQRLKSAWGTDDMTAAVVRAVQEAAGSLPDVA